MRQIKPIPIILTEQEIQRFWKHVDQSAGLGPRGECWEWTGSKMKPHPYGLFTIYRFQFKRTFLVHRLAYLIQYSNPNHLCVCHHCDNPSCVRKEHLFLGTYQDNKDDSVAKGRHFQGPRDTTNFMRGDKVHWAKLTTEQTLRIIDLQKTGMTASQIFRTGEFPVSRRTIAYILEHQTWKHL